MFRILTRKLWRFCSRIRRLLICWRPRPKLIIRRLKKMNSKGQPRQKPENRTASSHPNGQEVGVNFPPKPIRVATFNAALFSLAPAAPIAEKSMVFVHGNEDHHPRNDNRERYAKNNPKSILKQSPLHPSIDGTKPKLKVSINLPDNEISLAQNKELGIIGERDSSDMVLSQLGPVRSPICFPFGLNSSGSNWMLDGCLINGSRTTILDVLREVDADILALQDVKAEEEKAMRPLSDLAQSLGMNYVFAESWAPEYGNAILSKWPIKRFKVQRIFNDQDFRNVLKATIDVPWVGEMNFHCTQLDHLDENWRMKQINATIQSNDHPYILAGGLNSLDKSDYSSERWLEITKYFEEIGKPTPKVEVMNFLNGKGYTDAKGFAGECEPVVIIAKGQNVQGTCKYGTRVDYILSSPGFPYKFVPGSYSVISSKGTSDHHIVKVDIVKEEVGSGRRKFRKYKKLKQRVVRNT